MTAASLLSVERLAKRFGGVRAVDDVTFGLAAGEVLAVIGPNGAGKSTCFNLIGGQLPADAGRVRLAGRDILGLPPQKIWRRGVGRTFQVAATFASMSVAENVQQVLIAHHRRAWALRRAARRLYRDRAHDLLAQVGMAAQAERPCAVLAYGDVKRVELAMALANDPVLVLMDEPTAGMAPPERAQLMALIARLARERGTAVLFTEHDMDVVFAEADRILVLDRGAVLAEGPPQRVRDDPQVRATYLGGATATDPVGAPA
jgi:branched-chain amino acid transport system ATP-binding protein